MVVNKQTNKQTNCFYIQKTKENEDTTTQNLWSTRKAVLREKFIALQVHLKKSGKAQINNPTLHFKVLEKEQQTKPKVNKREGIIAIGAEINEINSKTINTKD